MNVPSDRRGTWPVGGVALACCTYWTAQWQLVVTIEIYTELKRIGKDISDDFSRFVDMDGF